jgi:hypothetical protein
MEFLTELSKEAISKFGELALESKVKQFEKTTQYYLSKQSENHHYYTISKQSEPLLVHYYLFLSR